MPNLNDVERRIKSVGSTRQITNTMYMVSSAKVGKSSNRMQKAGYYSNNMCQILSEVCSSGEAQGPLTENHDEIKNELIIVVTSDKGLAGGFNSNILNAVDAIIKENKKNNIKTHVIAFGKKADGYYSFRNIDAVKVYTNCSEDPNYDIAQEIGDLAIDGFTKGVYDKVRIVYNKCKNNIEQTVEQPTIMPITTKSIEEFTQNFAAPISKDENDVNKSGTEDNKKDGKDKQDNLNAGENSPINTSFIYEPSKDKVLSSILPLYVKTIIYSCLLDSAAGEQVARRVAMQAATDAADDMIDALTHLYNTVRQGAITTEINEIVGGAEALNN